MIPLAITVFRDLEDVIIKPFVEFTDKAVGTFASSIGAPLSAAVTIYVAFYGFQILRGTSEEFVSDFMWRAFKIAVIAAFCMNVDVYKTYVMEPAADAIPKGFQNAFLGGKPAADSSQFDQMFTTCMKAILKCFEGTGITVPGRLVTAFLLAFLISVASSVSLVAMFAVTMWAKAGVLFVLALGPVMIALAMFKATEKFFHNFVDQVVTFVVMQVLAAMVLAVAVVAIGKVGQAPMAPGTMAEVAFANIICMLFCTKVTMMLPMLAGKLGGYGASFAHAAPPYVAGAKAMLGMGAAAAHTVDAATGGFGQRAVDGAVKASRPTAEIMSSWADRSGAAGMMGHLGQVATAVVAPGGAQEARPASMGRGATAFADRWSAVASPSVAPVGGSGSAGGHAGRGAAPVVAPVTPISAAAAPVAAAASVGAVAAASMSPDAVAGRASHVAAGDVSGRVETASASAGGGGFEAADATPASDLSDNDDGASAARVETASAPIAADGVSAPVVASGAATTSAVTAAAIVTSHRDALERGRRVETAAAAPTGERAAERAQSDDSGRLDDVAVATVLTVAEIMKGSW